VLPTVTVTADNRSRHAELSDFIGGSVAGSAAPRGDSAGVPCAFIDVGDVDLAPETAERCDACAIATDCLLQALRFEAARRRGEDLWGAYGCWGGVWFQPGVMPHRIAHRTVA